MRKITYIRNKNINTILIFLNFAFNFLLNCLLKIKYFFFQRADHNVIKSIREERKKENEFLITTEKLENTGSLTSIIVRFGKPL